MITFAWDAQNKIVLDKDKPFALFDLAFDPEEAKFLSQLQVTKTVKYYNYGEPQPVGSDAYEFLTNIGNSQLVSFHVAAIIERTAERVRQAFGMDSALVHLSATLPNDDYDITRWHFDGPMFDEGNPEQAKFVTTLTGPGTLFHPLDPNLRASFITTLNQGSLTLNQSESDQVRKDRDLETRKKLIPIVEASKEKHGTETVQTQFGAAAIFMVGPDHSAVHSEPPHDKPRLFFSVVPGTQKQIKDREEMLKDPKGYFERKYSKANK